MREETRCRHMGYSFRLTARVLLYAPSHRQDSTYHDLWYTSRGTLAWTRNSSMGPPWRIDPTTHRTMSERSYHGDTYRSLLHPGINTFTIHFIHRRSNLLSMWQLYVALSFWTAIQIYLPLFLGIIYLANGIYFSIVKNKYYVNSNILSKTILLWEW